MRATLSLHPDSPRPAVSRIAVEIERAANGVLNLRYRLDGAVGDLAVPSPSASVRTDDLWRRTCFEAFVRAGEDEGYCELNFSPSTQWAAYRFTGYREGMTPAELPAVAVGAATGDGAIELSASVDLSRAVTTGATWRLGLSAVVEAADGSISHWALAHAPGRADFHHPESFALELPEPA